MKAKTLTRAVDRKSTAAGARHRGRQAFHAFGPGQALLRSAFILQPSLRVGAANDPLEREAETTADRVVSMPAQQAPASESPAPSPGTQALALRAAEDQPNLETLETEPAIPVDHQDPEVPSEEDVDTTGLDDSDVKEIETGKAEDTAGEEPAPDDSPPPKPPGEPTAQPARSDGGAAVVGAEGGAAPPDVSARVAQPGIGRRLPATVRAFMEPRFGVSFSDVRVHDAPADRRAAKRIGARAFTHRRDIWLGPGESVDNRRLMAHELTHVVQQTPKRVAPLARREVSADQEQAEPEVRRGWIANKAEKYARHVPGYTLISVILGKSPITGNRVERNATNLIGGFMGLIPGGTVLFDRLKESRALEEAFQWVSTRLNRLNLTWARITGLIDQVIDAFPTWSPVKAIKRIFGPVVRDILTFISEIKDKILELILHGALKLAGSWGEKVWGVIQEARDTISTILADPIGFAKNLFAAVMKGFSQFSKNVWEHLKKGLLGWLFGTLKGIDITLPAKLDFRGLISIGLQILGLTYEKFRPRLVKKLGKQGERIVSFLETSVEVVKILAKEGFTGIWQRILSMIDNFKQTVIGGIQDFVIKSLIMGGISWLAGLSNPVGAIVKVALSIYNLVVTFLERLDQIIEVAKSIFSSIGAIARGQIQKAADFVEKTISATIPVVISFLAALVPVTGITSSIQKIIKKVQSAVGKALEKALTFLAKKGKKLFSKLIGKLNKKRKLPSANFKVGNKQHRVYAEKKGKSVSLFIASKPTPIERSRAETKAEVQKLQGAPAKKIGGAIQGEVAEAEDQTGKAKKKVKLDSKNTNQRKPLQDLKKQVEDAAKEIETSAKGAEENPEINTNPDGNTPLIRAQEPRDGKVEGQADAYRKIKKLTKDAVASGGAPGDKKSSFYEVDHVIEKAIPKALLKSLKKFEPVSGPIRVGSAGAKGKKPTPLGELGNSITKIDDDANDLPAMAIFHHIHAQKTKQKPPKPDALIKAAEASPDPRDSILKALRTELDREKQILAGIYRQDKDAPKDVRQSVDTSIAKLETLNKTLYGITAAGAKVNKVDDKKRKTSPESTLTFDNAAGEPGKPDFTKVEGEGKAYSKLQSAFKGSGQFINFDHTIDKAWPLKAKNQRLVEGSFVADIDAWIKTNKPKAKVIPNRRKRLKAARIFPVGSAMANYTEGNGFAIAIYRPIHHRVTNTVGTGGVAKVITDARDELKKQKISDLGDFFIGARKDLQPAHDFVKAKVDDAFTKKTEQHAKATEAEYSSEVARVVAANPPAAQGQAKKAMQEVIKKVNASTATARAETTRLLS